VGFKTYLRLAPSQVAALSGHVEVILFQHGYAGLQMVEGDQANLCLLIHRDHLARVGGTWPALIAALSAEAPHLAARLQDAAELLEKPVSIARVPYGFVHQPVPDELVYRLGDQACVIPSFTGDGMSMALHSAALAVRSLQAGQTAFEYHQQLARDVAGPIRRAWALYRLGRAGFGRAVLIHALRLWPSLLGQTAAYTRVARKHWLEE
jgi:flavin-dependent dehydrogenase